MQWSPLRLAVVAALLVTAACLVSTEMASEDVGRFWADHPVSATLITGATLLGVGYFGLEEWVRRREVRREDLQRQREVLQWKRVKSLAYRALVQELGDVRRRMSQLVSAIEDPYRAGLRVDRYRRWELLDILRRCPEIEQIAGHPGQRERLMKLLDDWEYVVAFNRRVLELKRDYYAAIASWSSVMLQTPDLAADLDALARVGDELVGLERVVHERPRGAEWQPDDGWKGLVIDRFRRVRMRACLMEIWRFQSTEKAAFPWHQTSLGPSRPELSLVDEERLVDSRFWDPEEDGDEALDRLKQMLVESEVGRAKLL